MKGYRRREWFLWLSSVFLGALFVAMVVLFLYDGAFAGRPGVPNPIRSGLAPDYGAADKPRSIGFFRLTILNDWIHDLGLSSNETDQQGVKLLAMMEGSVPTATALNFLGDAPFTPTPNHTPTGTDTVSATDTEEPTATLTRMPIRPTTVPTTQEPTRTATKKTNPTKTPDPTTNPDPTSTPIASSTTGPSETPVPVDSQPPDICCIGGVSPDPGPTPACSIEVSVSEVEIKDYPYSDGIEWVKIKYEVDGDPTIYYSDPLVQTDGPGWTAGPGSTWHAFYGGSETIDVTAILASNPRGGYAMLNNFAAMPMALFDDIEVHVWIMARDNAGHSRISSVGTYFVPASCAP